MCYAAKPNIYEEEGISISASILNTDRQVPSKSFSK